ncbi:free fatty acid receptor 2-like [Eublepharis macularius]|uniref:Free fatty acid receptor 2-like n=1 Tax=Eublepharis macularius TaxID=481883 RepID=A0AA97KEY9_EUBMA|nr:free fatty acid receptor 2-like [Eublepharis macularius]
MNMPSILLFKEEMRGGGRLGGGLRGCWHSRWLNLTLSDILLLVFLPLKMSEAAHKNEWHFQEVLCSITSCTFHSSIYISTLFLTAISVDRYLGVAFPIKYKLNRRSVYAVVASVFIWSLVGSHCSTVFVLRSMRNDSMETSLRPSSHVVCYKEFNEQQKKIIYPFRLELCLILFCIPFVITCFCYIKVLRILASLPNVQPRKKQWSMGLAVVTLLNFVICFSPFNISHISGYHNLKDPTWRDFSFALSSFNTCLDPFIFFFSSNAMRRNVTVCWAGLYRRVRLILPQCSLPCCKRLRETDEGAGGAGLSSSSGLGGPSVGTESSSCGHAAKSCEVRALNPEQAAVYSSVTEGHVAH